MDSLTQIALGAAILGTCAPQQYTRQAIVFGAVLGTLPDLDVFFHYRDAVDDFTKHRGFTHSFLFLTPLALIIWVLLRMFCEPVRENPKPWLIGIMLVLITHPLLDAHNAYGTQLFWPFPIPPIMFSTLFVIDPLYTLPLLATTIFVWIKFKHKWARNILIGGLALSTTYLIGSWAAKMYVEHQAKEVLAKTGDNYRLFSTPTAFNILLWRIVAVQNNQYHEGYVSLLNPKATIQFNTHVLSNVPKSVLQFDDVQRLDWFTQGFNKKQNMGDYMIVSDLRMGYEDNYVFQFAVGATRRGVIHPIRSIQLESDFNQNDLPLIWDKLVGNEPSKKN